MKQEIWIDTGPIVAFFNKGDHHHAWITAQSQEFSPPLYTCEPVLAETFFLLRKFPPAHEAFLQALQRKLIRVNFQLKDHVEQITKLIKRYKNIPMSLADACLVRASEINSNALIITCDSDFNVYRRNGRQIIQTLMP